MPKKDKDLEFDFFDIDINRLDEEWIGQPKIFFKYASELADAKRRLEEAKAELDVVKAICDNNVRNNPPKDTKLTETLITNIIIQIPKYKKAQKILRIKKHRVDILQAAVNALDHRKSALERLVSLHGQNYFAVPKSDIHSKEMVDDIEKGNARLAGKRRKRKKK